MDSIRGHLRPLQRRFLTTGALALIALAVVLVVAPQVAARHSFGALYTGTHSGGGPMEFNVNSDGIAINRVKFTNVPCQNEPGLALDSEITFSAGGFAITNHAFDEQVGSKWFSGSFPEYRSASGSYQFRTDDPNLCTTEVVTWSATTTAALPPLCSDTVDNDGDGKVDFGADPGCEGGVDNDETDPDTSAPDAPLFGRKKQKAGRYVSVGVGCPSEDCIVRATGSVSVPNVAATARRFTLRPAAASIPRGQKRTLKLKVSRQALAAIRRAIRRGKKVRANVAVAVHDLAGNRKVVRRTISLTR